MRRQQETELRGMVRQGMDAAEIAIRLGISHDAAYGRIRRMQKREAASV
jgi:DNA-binding CsgD family transcriptional regulator